MDGKTSIRYLQDYLREKDYNKCRIEEVSTYYYKLSEEMGELAKAMMHDWQRKPGADLKGTIDEELWDVMYYVLCLANCYGVDLEATIKEKEDYNNKRYPFGGNFEEGR